MYTDTDIRIDLPRSALSTLTLLEDAGETAWCVGGAVRDGLYGRDIHDVDIATSAQWTTVRDLAQEAGIHFFETGVAHGTITLLVEGEPVEVTTYRTEGSYSDSRHPDRVIFVSSIEEDLARRDFTVNAMAYHPTRGLFDPWNGRSDLDDHLLRCVGEPRERMTEDALRILRGLRFTSQLGFALETGTRSAMTACAPLLAHVAAERKRAELDRLLCGAHVADTLRDGTDILGTIIPELLPMVGFDQRTPYHIYDVWEHTVRVVAATPAEPLLRWSALFHDIGKPDSFTVDEQGRGHFYGHPKLSADLCATIARRLRFPRRFTDDLLLLVHDHDRQIIPDTKHVRRYLVRIGERVDLFERLIALKRADALAQAPNVSNHLEQVDELERCLEQVLEQNAIFSLHDLDLRGNDLLAAGMEPGPLLGETLKRCLEAVIDEKVPNRRDALLEFALDGTAEETRS